MVHLHLSCAQQEVTHKDRDAVISAQESGESTAGSLVEYYSDTIRGICYLMIPCNASFLSVWSHHFLDNVTILHMSYRENPAPNLFVCVPSYQHSSSCQGVHLGHLLIQIRPQFKSSRPVTVPVSRNISSAL